MRRDRSKGRIDEGEAARRRLRVGIERSKALVDQYRRRLLLLRRALEREGLRAR